MSLAEAVFEAPVAGIQKWLPGWADLGVAGPTHMLQFSAPPGRASPSTIINLSHEGGIQFRLTEDDRNVIQADGERDDKALDMTETDRPRLRDLLAANYDYFIGRLTNRLHSRDAAIEALHETFLRLDRMTNCAAVQSPKSYIFHAAVNIAKNRRKAETYRISASEFDGLSDVPDDSPNQARTVEARSEIDALKVALRELSPRRREILNAISIEGIPPREVAIRLQVSLRTVETDLKHALEHCAARLDHKLIRRNGGPRPRC